MASLAAYDHGIAPISLLSMPFGSGLPAITLPKAERAQRRTFHKYKSTICCQAKGV